MEHFRLRKYRGPEVWARARIAYEEGWIGPEVARRFDVGLANLRKKALREGWTRKDQAAAADRAVADWPGSSAAAPLDPGLDPGPSPDLGPSFGPPTRPAVAVAAAVARASAALAGGRAAEAAGLLRAAETLARVADVDPAEAPFDDGPLTPEADAAREAEAKKAWDDHLDFIEAQADALARRILADAPHGPAVHSGFVHAWRAHHLGPEAAVRDRTAMQDRAAHRVPFHWDDAGRPLPVDEVRAMYYEVFRAQIRARAGLPAVAPGEGELRPRAADAADDSVTA